MRRIFKRMTALAALTALVLCAGCGASDPAPAAAEARTGERETLGLLMAREDPFLTELKEQIQAEAAARGYDVRAYNAGNDPEAQLRQVHQALADGVETLLVNLAEGEDAEKIAGIVGDAGVVLINRAPETAILDVRSRAEILLPAPARDGRWLESVFCFGRRPADTARSGRPRQPGV